MFIYFSTLAYSAFVGLSPKDDPDYARKQAEKVDEETPPPPDSRSFVRRGGVLLQRTSNMLLLKRALESQGQA